uniref:MATE family efflux transporter n=1 Tax=Ignisphaera aggregans TaxID=334771 RepID=A0A7C5YX44_9CREN
MAKGMPREYVSKYREAILNGSIIPTFLRIGTPMLIVRLVQDVYGLVDAFWLSRYSQFAVAVPRQVWPSYMLFIAFIMAFTSANLAIISQYAGAKMYHYIGETASKMLFISIVSSILSGLIFYFTAPYIFTYLVATPTEIYNDVVSYAHIMCFDILFLSINMTLATLIQSLGDTKTVAISQIIGSIANVFLDPIFIVGFGPIPSLGVAGAAIATVLSKVVSMSMLIYLLARRYPDIGVRIISRVDKEYLFLAFRILLPLLVMNISNSLSFNLQNRLINTFGIIAATAFTIGFIVFELTNTSLWGLTEGIGIMVGQNLGAGNIDRAKKIARRTSIFIFATVTATAAIVYLARMEIASIFITGQNVPQHIVDEIYSEINKFISLTIWTLAFFALTFSAMAVGRGSGYTLMPTIINMVRLWGLRIGLGYLLALTFSLETLGIYIAFAVSNIIGGLLSILWIYIGTWAKPVIKEVRTQIPKPIEIKPIPITRQVNDSKQNKELE